jgi:hypothetical protein
MTSQDRARMTQALVNIMRADIREAARRDHLATGRLLFGIEFGSFEEGGALWNSVWADVMAQTDCRQWHEIMNEGKH